MASTSKDGRGWNDDRDPHGAREVRGDEAWKHAPSRETTSAEPDSANQRRARQQRHEENGGEETDPPPEAGALRGAQATARGATMTLTSPSFGHGETIPMNHTSDGANLAPALAWAGVPPGAKSLALLVDDPDAPDPAAPQRTFTHWIVYNLPASAGGLALGADRSGLPSGAKHGRNDFGRLGYAGPKPPVGRHRYIFRLFALDCALPESLGHCDRAALLGAMHGHVVAEAELMGTYEHGNGHPAATSTPMTLV